MRALAALAAAALMTSAPVAASAFCGFYVSGADAKLFNNATTVVLMREGTRTVLSMQNDYQGPPDRFAMVVPVPVVLQKENVRTLPREVFDHVDQLSAPRLVEYWEQDPCAPPRHPFAPGAKGLGLGAGAAPGAAGGADLGVRIEAQFTVGEYEVVILSASDSLGLDTWLKGNGYHIPDGAEPVLRPYVQAGMKFFVAKVDVTKVKVNRGRSTLSPLRFHYDSDTFTLPVRLGLLNSSGTQDLVAIVLARGQRYDVANHRKVTIPTNLDVGVEAKEKFGAFYAALFDRTIEEHPGAVVTEYAWDARTCDPCPGPALSPGELASLGLDVLPSTPSGDCTQATGRGPIGNATIGGAAVTGGTVANASAVVAGMAAGFRRCYNKGLAESPTMKGSIRLTAKIGPNGEVLSVTHEGAVGLSNTVIACMKARVSSAQFAPPEGGGAVIAIPVTLVSDGAPNAPPPPSGQPPRPCINTNSGAGFVLTRLHARYSKSSLGDDLVFSAAEPIQGGREGWDANGKLEHGAKPGPYNNFQARYAIRHPWTGAVACENPHRGIWGGPPAGQAGGGETKAARDLAFAPRGGIDLAAMLRSDAPEIGIKGLTPPAPPAATPSAGPSASGATGAAGGASKGCGCALGREAGFASASWGLAAAALSALLRRRRIRA